MTPMTASAPAVVRAGSLRDSIHVEPLTHTIGAELSNVDLGVASRDPALVAEIRGLLLRYRVLFFRDQDITRAEHVAFGLLRVFDDAHPALGDWVRQALPEGAGASAPLAPGPLAAAIGSARPAPARTTPGMVLTPKEREVLSLLTRHLSNKEIGLTMQVGEETIKWHMKNLFAKLDAGTRKQVVSRARILGLLAEGA